MKATENRDFPYPECDPPLVKDASQIVQMKLLAEAIDLEVQALDDELDDVLVQPASARLTTTALTTATTETLVTPTLDLTLFERNWGPTAAEQGGGLYIPETAWWMVGAHASVDSAAAIRALVRVTVDGLAASSWGNPGAPYSTIFQLPALGMLPLQINAGSILNMQIKHDLAGAPAWNYRPHLWAQKLVAL